jgi:hypothetical protein
MFSSYYAARRNRSRRRPLPPPSPNIFLLASRRKRSRRSSEASAFHIDPHARHDVSDLLKKLAWYKAQGLVEANAEARGLLDLSFVKSHLNVGYG